MNLPRTRPGPESPPSQGFIEGAALLPLGAKSPRDVVDAFGALAQELPGEKRILKIPKEEQK